MVQLFVFLLGGEQLLTQIQIVGAQNFAALRHHADFGFQRIEFSDHATTIGAGSRMVNGT